MHHLLAKKERLDTDWPNLFKTVGLSRARLARSLKHERLVPIEPEENPMPSGTVMGHETAEDYLRTVNESFMNPSNPDLYVIPDAISTEGFISSMDPENSSSGTGPFEIPSEDDMKQLHK